MVVVNRQGRVVIDDDDLGRVAVLVDDAGHDLLAVGRRQRRDAELDRALRENFWEMGESTAATLFPLLSGEFVSNVVIENVTLDGNMVTVKGGKGYLYASPRGLAVALASVQAWVEGKL